MTLNYEMMFNAIFAVCLFIKPTNIRLTAICAGIVSLWLVGSCSSQGSYIHYASKDIILEFAAGIGLWALCRKFISPTWLAWFLVVMGFVGLALPDLLHVQNFKTFIVGPAACALGFAAISLEARADDRGRVSSDRAMPATRSTSCIPLCCRRSENWRSSPTQPVHPSASA